MEAIVYDLAGVVLGASVEVDVVLKFLVTAAGRGANRTVSAGKAPSMGVAAAFFHW